MPTNYEEVQISKLEPIEFSFLCTFKVKVHIRVLRFRKISLEFDF
jgi:hypothetical protein